MEWYAFYPADTLMVKGAEPMEMGADHHGSQIFPPPAQTIIGALRTAALNQNGIDYGDYYNNIVDSDLLDAIGESENSEPFLIAGPVFRIGRDMYVPAPFLWFCDKAEKKSGKAHVFIAHPTKSRLIKTGQERLCWVAMGQGELISIGGKWIHLEDLGSGDESIDLFDPDHFFEIEPRTGIALNRNRSVKEGHLYTFHHVRLKPEVSLAFGVDATLPIADKGFLKLGGEQRFGRYEKIDQPVFPSIQSDYFLALNMVKGSRQANQAVIATGKVQYIGGWDLKKGFHKPMQGYFPAGSVFSEKIHPTFVQL